MAARLFHFSALSTKPNSGFWARGCTGGWDTPLGGATRATIRLLRLAAVRREPAGAASAAVRDMCSGVELATDCMFVEFFCFTTALGLVR
jgi:hypothetical protein